MVAKTTTLIRVGDHAVKYVDGRVHTNGLEAFGSLEAWHCRNYVSVEPFTCSDIG
jgi:hypothetical protein